MDNTNNINKPLSLIMEESKRIIIDAINQANLHPTLLELVIKDIYNEVQYNAQAFAERERNEYEQAIAQSIETTEE